ncbi:hypothetical protein DES53_101821 [Roseimicrobium gellanilyticum]|uniref:Uncharacterized protein n=1 Tax=Roseimicrobium gellanilyticum TaxID=748857 RepID=A0A366HUQ8_9BACT|nr:hypothetical protein [Roseimicrobium gellanilyticum]RBP48021.1 hypothetical protein DES53_101821 [Roseimicrobium gellanilyticum]
MIELTEFSLNTNSSFGVERSQLLRNGQPVALHLEGTVLRHQFETAYGYLFITDYDCVFEEVVHISLCSLEFQLLSSRTLGWPTCSFNLCRVEWQDDTHLMMEFIADDWWMLTIRPWGIPFLRPRLGLSRMSDKAPSKCV